MRKKAMVVLTSFVGTLEICMGSLVAGQAPAVPKSPAAREITDPRSIKSLGNPAARPVPIDNLYYTRTVGGAAWSLDGREILFTTDMSGRYNLWKVAASGGWPLQLS